jgi:nucleotide-binding universal stress UspA family protein
MGYKTILVHFRELDRSRELLNVAAMVAKQFDAHLIGLYIVPGIQNYPSISRYIPAESLVPQKKYQLDKAAEVQAMFTKITKNNGVAAEWRQIDPIIPNNISQIIVANSHTVDLVILGQSIEEKDEANVREMPGDVLLESGRPVLVVPHSGTFKNIGDHILIGWNGTKEAARATFDALPFLKSASQVHVHSAIPSKPHTNEITISGAELANSLARHDVVVSVETNVNPDLAAGDELLSYVAQRGADLLVMGGYGRSRTRELIFGGATKEILNHMTVPVLMSH